MLHGEPARTDDALRSTRCLVSLCLRDEELIRMPNSSSRLRASASGSRTTSRLTLALGAKALYNYIAMHEQVTHGNGFSLH